jgi:hypothetical protein
MPLSINVGLSRKASRDYQSTGVSINVTAELDSALLQKPAELQQQIAGLYAQAEFALDRQANGKVPAAPASRTNGYAGTSTRSNVGNGQRNGSGMTASQRKAILSIASRNGVDAAAEAQDRFGTSLDDLTLRQASELIDYLKRPAVASNGRGAARR